MKVKICDQDWDCDEVSGKKEQVIGPRYVGAQWQYAYGSLTIASSSYSATLWG